MDIIITEIIEDNGIKIQNFNNEKDKILDFLKNRFLNLSDACKKKEKINSNIKLNTNINTSFDLVKIVYGKLFNLPHDGIYDHDKLKVIQKHLKKNNLI